MSLSRLVPAVVIVLAFPIVHSSRPLRAESSHPNVLLIAVDDLNDWVGPLGGHPQTKTPNFDRLAARGVTFTNAHCNVPICSPSRTSLMTGLQPYRRDVFTNGDNLFDLDGMYATLPEHFAESGYATLGAGKLFHGSGGRYATLFHDYGPGTGNQGGPFTKEELNTQNQNPTHRVDRGPGKLQATLPLNGMPDDRRGDKDRNNSFDWGPVDVTTDEMPDGQIANWAVEQLGGDFDKPFFMGVGFYRPHQPLFAPEKYFKPFLADQTTLPEVHPDDVNDLPDYAVDLARFPLTAGSHSTVVRYNQWDDAVASYLACVHFIDDLLGNVLDALDTSNHADNTWIVLFSDHGYHLGEKEHWGKFTTWHRSTHVPLIIVPPKSFECRRGASVDTAVSLIDLYPTLVDVCGISAPEHDLDGESLKPYLASPPAPSKHRYAITTVGRGTHSVVDDRYRYIRYFDGSEELYDRQTDPNEWHNLAGDTELADERQRLAEQIPDEPEVAHYVRYGDWKAILFKDAEDEPILYRIEPGTGSGGGIGETRNMADAHPDVVREIRQRLDRSTSDEKRRVLAVDQ